MSILVINSGSSSIKAALFSSDQLICLINIQVEEINGHSPKILIGEKKQALQCPSHEHALEAIFQALSNSHIDLKEIAIVGHRVLHGGEYFTQSVIITDEVEQKIESMKWLAPLHTSACLSGIRIARDTLNDCQHIAVFDTAFHASLPEQAQGYALPKKVIEKFNLRRYGFHGISHQYVSQITIDTLRKKQLNASKIISCHLGNGCSITAIKDGMSIETSMGMTPLEGLVMGTRCGDIGPSITIKLMRDHVNSPDELEDMLNRRSGLLGLTGTNDMREIAQRANNGDQDCQKAIDLFVHRIRKYIGSYAAALGGVDAIIFTGGIGENSAMIREKVAQDFQFLNIELDNERNLNARLSTQQSVITISTKASRTQLLLVQTNEELAIAKSTRNVVYSENH